jgi:hypothetical protein
MNDTCRQVMGGSDETSGRSPVHLEVIAPIVQGLGICSTCELILAQARVGEQPAERALGEYPEEWQADYRRLLDWVVDLAGRYGDQILIKVIDPQSAAGLFKSLRHRVRRYPTFLIEGKKVVGWERDQLESAITLALAARHDGDNVDTD